MSHEIAVIMRCKDEMPYVERAILALQAQHVQNFTLYHIDSGSSDGSLEVIYHLNPEPKNVYEIEPQSYLPGRVLNQMIARTWQPYIVFLNADAIPLDNKWLEKLLQPLLDNEADATFSRQVARGDARFIVDDDYQRAYCRQNIEGKNPNFFSAVACAFKRELWDEQKFYEEGFSEDMEWAYRLRSKGKRFLLVEDSIVEHSHNYSFREFFHRKWIEGQAERLIFGRQANMVRQALAALREMIRDLIRAVAKGAILTIPYNIAYRLVGHTGFYRGLKNG